MKKLSAICIFLLVGFIVHAEWVQDNEFRFKIDVPGNYTKTKETEGSDKVHSFIRNDNNVLIQVRTMKLDSRATVDLLQSAFETHSITNARRLLDKRGDLHGITAKTAAYSWDVNGTATVIGAYYIIQDGIGYVLWSLVPQNMINTTSAEADRIMESFDILPGVSTQQGVVQDLFAGAGSAKEQLKISRIETGSKLKSKYQVAQVQNSFSVETPFIYLVFDYSGLVANDPFQIKWKSITYNQTIAEVSLPPANLGSGSGNSELTMNGKPWPVGDYNVEIWHNGVLISEMAFGVVKTSTTQAPVYNYQFETELVPPAGVQFHRPANFKRTKVEEGQTVFGREGNTSANWFNLVVQPIIRGAGGYANFQQGVDDMLGQVNSDADMQLISRNDFQIQGMNCTRYDYYIAIGAGRAVKIELAVDAPKCILFLSYVTLEKNTNEAEYLMQEIVKSLQKSDPENGAVSSGGTGANISSVATLSHLGYDFSDDLNRNPDGETVNWCPSGTHPQYSSAIWWRGSEIKHYGQVDPSSVKQAPTSWDANPTMPLLNGHVYVLKCKDGFVRIKVLGTAPNSDNWPAKVEYTYSPNGNF